MKHFSCGDVIPGCAATFTAASDDELLGGVAAHATAAHGLVEVPADVVDRVRAAIRSVPAA
jgi:predicted small metal-binding protein